MPELTLSRLRWIAILSGLGFIVVLELVRQALLPILTTWTGRLFMDTTVFVGALFFFGAVFHLAARLQQRLERQNRELLSLHAAALDVHAELGLEAVLQRVVDQARALVDARYGAISVIDDRHRIETFLTSGITPEQRAAIGPPPVGHGLLAVVLDEEQRLRLPDIGRDPRSVGFPAHHPPMRSLLAVPIVCTGPHRGNLYLTEKISAPEFSVEDEQSLVRFATTAAIAIDNAHLHQKLSRLAVAEERLRIAHEMHDGLAQVLAYVNTKAQAVREFLKTGRTEQAEQQLEQLAGAAREVYADVRESIIGLRAVAKGDRTLGEAIMAHVATFQNETGIECRLDVDPDLRLSPVVELQLLRIVQEGLANVRKHARARSAEVMIARADGRVTVQVKDDGSGFNPAELGRSEFPRFGLATMRERAESLGGTMVLESMPGAGTTIVVDVPLPASS